MNTGPTPKISVSHSQALPGEPVTLIVSGLKPGSAVTITTEQQIGEKRFQSNAVFSADSNGRIDLDRHAPIAGSYSGVNPWGPFWSMASSSTPDPIGSKMPPLIDGQVAFHALSVDGWSGSATFQRLDAAPQVQEVEVRKLGLYGVLYLSPGVRPLPVIIILGGSEGGLSTCYSAKAWASRGYAALALAYFGVEGLPAQLREIPIEYFGKAISYLNSREDIDSERIAIMGTSRGGELALLVASIYPAIRAVVARTPSHVSWGANDPTHKGQAPAWTFEGQSIPHVDYREDFSETMLLPDGREVYHSVPAFLKSLQVAVLSEAEIAIEKINGPILMTVGIDDQLWPASYFVARANARLKAKSHKFKNETWIYPDAGHVFCFPGDPAPNPYFFHPVTQMWIDLGGSPQGNAAAGIDAFRRIAIFLDRALKLKFES